MPQPPVVADPLARPCLRCSGAMIPCLLSVRQQAFPFEWVMQIDALNGPDGRNVCGWGAAAKRSAQQRRQLEASRRQVTALRCATCGMVELGAI